MVPDHDDDMTQDFEVLPDTDEARGGPVGKPGGDATRAPSKGKISQQSARRIWFICIGVSVLAVAAVVVDVVFDPLKRRPVAVNTANHEPPPAPKKGNKPEMTEHQKLATEFKFGTYELYKKMEGSRACDMARMAIRQAREAGEVAKEDRDNAEAWQTAWKQLYHAFYTIELFKHRWPHDSQTTPFVGDLDDNEAILALEDEVLASQEMRSFLASSLLFEKMYVDLSTLERQWNGIAKASTVKTEDEDVKQARKKYEAARDKREFEQADIDAANQPPRGPDEPAPYLE